MDLVREWVALSIQVAALTMLLTAAEALLPGGKLKNTAMTGIGLLFLAAVVGKIIGIFDRMGV